MRSGLNLWFAGAPLRSLTPNHSPESSAHWSSWTSGKRVGNEKGSIDRSSYLFASNSDAPVPNSRSSFYSAFAESLEAPAARSSSRDAATLRVILRQTQASCAGFCFAWRSSIRRLETRPPASKDSTIMPCPDSFVSSKPIQHTRSFESFLKMPGTSDSSVVEPKANLSSKPHPVSHHSHPATVEALCVPANLTCNAVIAPVPLPRRTLPHPNPHSSVRRRLPLASSTPDAQIGRYRLSSKTPQYLPDWHISAQSLRYRR